MSLADVACYYVCGEIIVFFIILIYKWYEWMRYDEFKIDHIDWVAIVTAGVFWPVYTIKYGLKGLVVVFNRLIYDMIHW